MLPQDIILPVDFQKKLANMCVPYLFFSRERWSKFRCDTPLTLTEEDITTLRSINDPIDLQEVETIYLALSRFLRVHFLATNGLFLSRKKFLQVNQQKSPFIIGIGGSVAVGKSTTARLLKALLSAWPERPKVDLVTTDGFLYPNAKLEKMQKMRRKGFPDSYDINNMLSFLAKVKSGERCVEAPCYSHLVYDVVDNETQVIDQPDILIFEGLNVLQVYRERKQSLAIFVSDFFDISLYIDAEKQNLERWYLERFKSLRRTAFLEKDSFFHRYALMEEEKALEIAKDLWQNINLKNLNENIEPTKLRASLILHKNHQHLVDIVAVRRL